MISTLIKSLIQVSEKAANIARICRSDEHLFSLLIEEKTVEDANPRFVNDFKTLADVLIQETVKFDLGNKFTPLRENIRGEESSTFSNVLGEKIIVEIFDTIDATADRLDKVLGGDKKAANILSKEVHRNITDVQDILDEIPEINNEIDLNNLGILIDPIDATNEYIKGERKESEVENIPASGLECVTVLIGVYDLRTGIPIMGVVNQPFYVKSNDSYQSKIYWGISTEDVKLSNVIEKEQEREKRVILSSSEDPKFIKILDRLGYKIIYSAGAGHKILKLITGEVDLYILSKPTTFKWDTCAPHAILLSQNYHLVDLINSLDLVTPQEVSYLIEEGKCNSSGVLGYRSDKDFEILKELEMAHYSMKVFVD